MIVTIDTDKQTVSIKGLTYFRELVDFEDFMDYEVVVENDDKKSIMDYISNLGNLSHT